MKQKFTVTIKQKGEVLSASCNELPAVTVEAPTKEAVLEKIKAAIINRLGGSSNDGTAPRVAPKPTNPHSPTILIETLEIPE